ncbi:hypothetical protein KW801_03820, partial [Candidatus Saccharibacteria bacterium]|nr:hypothetical protein [Candidatus Saccharibacteria bacterium]
MAEQPNSQTKDGAIKGTTLGYVVGFGLSLILTLVAFFLVSHKDSNPSVFNHRFLMIFFLSS